MMPCACQTRLVYPSRRRAIGLLAAATAASALRSSPGVAQSPAGIIDTHHHIYPPNYTKANIRRIVDDSFALPASAYTGWSPSASLDQMDKAGIRTAITSITSPGVWWDNGDDGRRWSRECNEYGAKLAADYPGRFGMFAAIPLPDTDGSLAEIAHALDVLKLDGIGLLTSYAGKPLGDRSFDVVFDELNRRRAVVFVHPTMSCCGMAIPKIFPPAIDFPTDTTRTIASLALGGAFARYPDVKFIFSHGGGTLPIIAQRLEGQLRNFDADQVKAMLPDGFLGAIKKQHYDLASIATNRAGMAAVLAMIPASQLFYGSDAPFASTKVIADAIGKFDLSPADIEAIRRGNAQRLFPRFAA